MAAPASSPGADRANSLSFTPRSPRPGASIDNASSTFVLPAPFGPTSTTCPGSTRRSNMPYERKLVSIRRVIATRAAARADTSALGSPKLITV